MRTFNSKILLFLTGLVWLVVPVAAQLKVGDNVQLTSTGSISAGYSDSWGNQVSSSHGFNFGGVGTVSGSYYSPSFLSFAVTPYYNQSSANSEFQSITNATGVALSTSIFSGSKFPGSVNYSADYNKEGEYAIPGSPNYVTSGHGQGLGIGWAANLPNAPSVSIGYSYGNSAYDVYGTNENGSNSFNNFFTHVAYRWNNFSMAGGFNINSSSSEIPQIFSTGLTQTSNSDSKSYYFTVGHPLPMHGSTSVNFSRTDLNSDYEGYSFDGNIDNVSAFAGVSPTQKWSVSASANYTDNLNGVIYQSIFPTSTTTAGSTGLTTGTVQAQDTSQSAHAWDFELGSGYAILPNLQVRGQYEHRDQSYRGVTYTSDSVSAGGIYGRTLFGGSFNANGYVTDNESSNTNGYQLGFSGNASYNRRFGAWNVTTSGGYGQNVQTLLVAYTTSNYGFGGSVGRRMGVFTGTVGASVSHSGLTAQPGTSYSSQSYSAGFGVRWLTASANYSKSDGNGLATGGGISPIPLPPVIPPSLLILYGGTSYAFSLSGTPIRHLTMSASYVNANGNTTNQGVFSTNHLQEEIFYTTYRFRKVGVNGGYNHLVQGFSATGTAPASFSSFYIGLYRWFNFF